MKKSPPRSRRHRNPKSQEGEQTSAFFPKVSDNKVQAKEDPGFFQPKLEVAPANDPQEKEADAVANKVVNNVQHGKATSVQKKEKVNRMAEQEEPAAKLQRMGQEEEPAAKLQRMSEKEKPAAKLQRMGQEEEPAAKLQAQSNNQPKAEQQKKKEASSQLEQMIQETKGKGFALPNDTRTDMEGQFNVDFSKVRIHTNLVAVKMCNMINAQAFTHGFDIYFNDGKYNPDTETGQNLLAHELTHVVQQKGG